MAIFMRGFGKLIKIVITIAYTVLIVSSCSDNTEFHAHVSDVTTEQNTQSDEISSENNEYFQQSVSILFFSDTQADPATGDYTAVGNLIEQAVSRHGDPDVVIFGGDTVNDGGDIAEWSLLMDLIRLPLQGVTTAAVPGNHDIYLLLSEQFEHPTIYNINERNGYFYSFLVDSVLIIMLDSNHMGAANPEDIEWLSNELETESAQKAKWIIAVMHHPMWSVTENPRDIQRASTMRENFLPLLVENHVSLILCGHQHMYSRTMPMSSDSSSNDMDGGDNDIAQIMVASGDKSYYSSAEYEYVVETADAPNYALMSISDDALSVIVYGVDGQIIDSFSIIKTIS